MDFTKEELRLLMEAFLDEYFIALGMLSFNEARDLCDSCDSMRFSLERYQKADKLRLKLFSMYEQLEANDPSPAPDPDDLPY